MRCILIYFKKALLGTLSTFSNILYRIKKNNRINSFLENSLVQIKMYNNWESNICLFNDNSYNICIIILINLQQSCIFPWIPTQICDALSHYLSVVRLGLSFLFILLLFYITALYLYRIVNILSKIEKNI